MKRLLVTGGCGFIGSNFVRLEIESYPDVEVTNLDALTYAANPANVASVGNSPLYAFEEADLRDPAALARAFERHRPAAELPRLPLLEP